MTIQVGDWVRFYRNGTLVIGVVEYVTKNVLGGIELHTDEGTTNPEYVLEMRRAT